MKAFKRMLALTVAAASLLACAACGAKTEPTRETTADATTKVEVETAQPTGNFTFTQENYPKMASGAGGHLQRAGHRPRNGGRHDLLHRFDHRQLQRAR